MQIPRFARICAWVVPVLTGPPILAFVPALTLGAFWLGGEPALIVAALGLPLVFVASGALSPASGTGTDPHDGVTGLILRDGFLARASAVLGDTGAGGLQSAVFVLELDDYRELADRHGQAAADTVMQVTGDRIVATLRSGDMVARTGDSRFAVCLSPVRQLDLELCIRLSGRLQAAIEDPVPLDGMSVYMTCSVGFCLRSRTPGEAAQDWVGAAMTALGEARQSGPSGIRAYTEEMGRKAQTQTDLRDEVAAALENGQIRPWFQPQINTDTGRISGFEALARWVHPVHGVIVPDGFLPALEEAGLMERLGQVMLYHALCALRDWDGAGEEIPRVGVNFSGAELRDPAVVERVRWELDRFELGPGRLNVEILETVVADAPGDMICRNIAGLAGLGCGIDLDDFGIGHASIAAIRRFSVTRIKIDRSFVAKADRDPNQQQLIGAILTMAERLSIDTLAEGVETVGEHALVAQLGCGHVQGFGIGRPMPFDQTLDWIAAHKARLKDTPAIGRETG